MLAGQPHQLLNVLDALRVHHRHRQSHHEAVQGAFVHGVLGQSLFVLCQLMLGEHGNEGMQEGVWGGHVPMVRRLSRPTAGTGL